MVDGAGWSIDNKFLLGKTHAVMLSPSVVRVRDIRSLCSLFALSMHC
jgi:hypothetical protein